MRKLTANQNGFRVIDNGGLYLEVELTAGTTTVRAVLDQERLSTLADAINLYVSRMDYAGQRIQQGGAVGEAHARHLRKNTPRDVLREEARKLSAK